MDDEKHFLTMEDIYTQLMMHDWPDREKTRIRVVRRLPFQLSIDMAFAFEGIGSVSLCEWNGHSI